MSASSIEAATTAAVSDAVARLFLDKFGKGPVQVETYVSGDVLTTVMHDVLTPAEHSMIDAGKADSVLTTRMLWQRTTSDMFKQSVSEATGRQVLSVVSGFELDQELATEVFLLEPA